MTRVKTFLPLNKLATYSLITITIAFLVGLVLTALKIISLGWSFFVIFPFAIGFFSGLGSENTPKAKVRLLYGTLGFLLFVCVSLIVGIEDLVCILLASPILIAFMVFGFVVGTMSRSDLLRSRSDKEDTLKIIFIPLVILVVSNVCESVLSKEPVINTITTSITLPYDAGMVFNDVKSMDTLDGEKPFLLKLGLPTPYKCVLADTIVGARRTCLFTDGQIVAEITEYHPGEVLQMKVIDYTLTGRSWFSFRDASYTFEHRDDGTKITRNTSYTSVLKPRWYWGPLEKMAIEQEHLFVLNSLRKNLGQKK